MFHRSFTAIPKLFGSCIRLKHSLFPLDLIALDTSQPAHTIFHEQLTLRLQFCLDQVEVVDCAQAENRIAGESGANPIHERATGGTEIIRHVVPGGYRGCL
jgi:hypothetical protein